MRGGGGQKMSVFVHAHGIKNCPHKGRGVKKWQNSVQVVVECPLIGVSSLVFDQSMITHFLFDITNAALFILH